MAGFDIGSSQSVLSNQIIPQQLSEADGENPNQLSGHINEGGGPTGAVRLVSRKPRGRPLGAKNKPKEPNFVAYESPNTIRAHLLEVKSGCDVLGSLVTYAHKQQHGICVLNATGRVFGVTLRDTTEAGGVLPLQGQFEIVSLSGTILPMPIQAGQNSLAVILTMGGARIMGGNVVGPLIAYGPVTVMAGTFAIVDCETLPLEISEHQYATEPIFSSDGVRGMAFPFLDMHAPLQIDRWTGAQAPF